MPNVPKPGDKGYTTYQQKLDAQMSVRRCPVWVVRHAEDSGFCPLDAGHRGTHQ